ncbi:MAG: DUF1517 domain-containing protein [Sandaracinaceae bacterium]
MGRSTPNPRLSKIRDPRFRTDHVPAAGASPPPYTRAPASEFDWPGHARIDRFDEYPERLIPPDWEGAAQYGAAAATGTSLLGSFGLLALFFFRRRRAKAAIAAARFDVRRISLAFDWTERAAIQEALEAMAGRYDMDSESGLHRAGKAVHALLRGKLEAARYGAYARFHQTAEEAEVRFRSLTNALAARFTEETVRGGDRREFAEMAAAANEGEGLVVVSVVVGADGHLVDLPEVPSRAAFDAVLEQSLPERASQLVAFEVIWSPSDENDRMSSAELEMLYPELSRLDGAKDIGRVRCGYCAAPYPAELGDCPSCGAPAPGSA